MLSRSAAYDEQFKTRLRAIGTHIDEEIRDSEDLITIVRPSPKLYFSSALNIVHRTKWTLTSKAMNLPPCEAPSLATCYEDDDSLKATNAKLRQIRPVHRCPRLQEEAFHRCCVDVGVVALEEQPSRRQ